MFAGHRGPVHSGVAAVNEKIGTLVAAMVDG